MLENILKNIRQGYRNAIDELETGTFYEKDFSLSWNMDNGLGRVTAIYFFSITHPKSFIKSFSKKTLYS